MSDLGTKRRERRGEKGFTLIELLVVVTIIGILAAIVSVSVGGFTGKAWVQARKTAINGVQAAVDAYIADHYDGSGAVIAPTATVDNTLTAASQTSWWDTNGVVQAAATADVVYRQYDPALLTKSTTSVLANTTRTFGPYLRLGGSPALYCVFKDLSNNPSGASNVDKMYQIVLCNDAVGTSQ